MASRHSTTAATAFGFVFTVTLSFSGCAENTRATRLDAGAADAASPPPSSGLPGAAPARYLALGDSFTIGTGSLPERSFPSRLTERWIAEGCALELRNVAINGYTSDDVVERELPSIAAFRPTFVTIAVGANDIVRGSPEATYRTNVQRILKAAAGSGARVVALPQPAWWRSKTGSSFGAPEELAKAGARFNAILEEEARNAGAAWVDLVPLMDRQASDGQLASDGLHPSADAYDAWAVAISRAIATPCANGNAK